MDILKREKENDSVPNFSDIAQIICEICGISQKQVFNINKEPAPLLNCGIKFIYLDNFN